MATFGITATQSYWNEGIPNYSCLIKSTLSENGDVSKLSVYTSNDGSACYIKGVIYAADGTAGAPYTFKGVGAAVQVPNGGAAWRDSTFASAVALTAGDYWLGIIGDADAANLAIYASGSGANLLLYADTYADGPMSPISGSPAGTYGVGPWSIYATYTATPSGIAIPVAMHHYRSMRG